MAKRRSKREINASKRTKTDAAELAELIDAQLHREDYDCPHGRANPRKCNVCRGRVLRHPNVTRVMRRVKGRRISRNRRREQLRYSD